MNIARNMEAIFAAAVLAAVTTNAAIAAVPAEVKTAPQLDGVVHTVVVTAKAPERASAEFSLAAK